MKYVRRAVGILTKTVTYLFEMFICVTSVKSVAKKLFLMVGCSVTLLLRGCQECPAAGEQSRVERRAGEIYVASWEQFDDAGRVGAYGIRFDPKALTCATRLWPAGTRIEVTDVHNGLSVVVRVVDVTPKKSKSGRDLTRRLDLSPAAFEKLNGLELGTCRVRVRVLSLATDGHR